MEPGESRNIEQLDHRHVIFGSTRTIKLQLWQIYFFTLEQGLTYMKEIYEHSHYSPTCLCPACQSHPESRRTNNKLINKKTEPLQYSYKLPVSYSSQFPSTKYKSNFTLKEHFPNNYFKKMRSQSIILSYKTIYKKKKQSYQKKTQEP